MTEFYLGIHERTSDLDIFPTHYRLSDNYYVGCMVGLCGCMAVSRSDNIMLGRMAVSLICWALWLCIILGMQ